MLPAKSRAGFIKPAEISSNVYWKYQLAEVTCLIVKQCCHGDFAAFVVNAVPALQGVCGESTRVAPMLMPFCMSGLLGVVHWGFLEHANVSCSYSNTR